MRKINYSTSHESARGRTWNLLLRRQTRCPLRHRSWIVSHRWFSGLLVAYLFTNLSTVRKTNKRKFQKKEWSITQKKLPHGTLDGATWASPRWTRLSNETINEPSSIDGSMGECSPATRAIRVRFPVDAAFYSALCAHPFKLSWTKQSIRKRIYLEMQYLISSREQAFHRRSQYSWVDFLDLYQTHWKVQ